MELIKNKFFECNINPYTKAMDNLRIFGSDNGVLDLNKFRELSDMRVMAAPLSREGSSFIKTLVLPKQIEKVVACPTFINHLVWPDACDIFIENQFAYSTLRTIENIDHVKVIEPSAFYDACIESFAVPPKVKTIPSFCFYNCPNLSEISGMENVQEIQNNAFQATKRLKSITGLEKVLYIDEEAFFSSGIESIDLSGGTCCFIGPQAFASSDIKEFKPSYFLKEIAVDAFEDTKIEMRRE